MFETWFQSDVFLPLTFSLLFAQVEPGPSLVTNLPGFASPRPVLSLEAALATVDNGGFWL